MSAILGRTSWWAPSRCTPSACWALRHAVYDRGAKAFKSKDLNYYYIDELLRERQPGDKLRQQKGRVEDPDVEILEHSGEGVTDGAGHPVVVDVDDFAAPKSLWVDGRRPVVSRQVMDFGYRGMSDIDWVDCV